jgi:hypothetical protein
LKSTPLLVFFLELAKEAIDHKRTRISLDLRGRIPNDLRLCYQVPRIGKGGSVLGSGGIIKSAMAKRGFRHRRTEDQFSIRGEYARNLQYVYSKDYQTNGGNVIDLIYFSVDILGEKLVIGLYRENPNIENGVYLNASRALDLKKFTDENVERELDGLITSVRDHI